MNKKYLIIVGLIILIILILIILFRPRTKPSQIVPTASPSATIQPTIATPSALQTPNDQVFSQAINSLVRQYPWYPQLPIVTSDFRIIYDFDKKSFRIRILTQSTDVIKQAAIEKLKAIGVDLTKFTYYFIEP